jgi:hypothetical protein
MKLTAIAVACLCAAASCGAQADDTAAAAPSTLAEAIQQGHSMSSLRLRDERVEQDGKAETANALTLRTLLGWQTAPLHGFSVGAQLINVGVFDDNYDNGAKGVLQPGRAAYPRIVDPDYTGINQLHVDWTGLPDTRLRLGRQSVKLDNVRFVGNVEFRQVMQVFDGVSVETKALLPKTTLYAAHFDQAVQVSTLRQSTNINLLNLRYAISPTENLIGYGYYVGWDRSTLQATSSRTLGARLDGARPLSPDWKVLYTAEYAKQDPYGDGAPTIDSHYSRFGAGAQYGQWYARIDREVLSSNHGLSAFQTPLGTNHLFQGWVDKFLVTPNAGIRDTFVTAGGKLGGVTLLTEYHWIDSDVRFVSGSGTGSRYGTEWDVSAAYPLRKDLVGKIEYGSFREKDPYTVTASSRVRNTDKLWVTMQYTF